MKIDKLEVVSQYLLTILDCRHVVSAILAVISSTLCVRLASRNSVYTCIGGNGGWWLTGCCVWLPPDSANLCKDRAGWVPEFEADDRKVQCENCYDVDQLHSYMPCFLFPLSSPQVLNKEHLWCLAQMHCQIVVNDRSYSGWPIESVFRVLLMRRSCFPCHHSLLLAFNRAVSHTRKFHCWDTGWLLYPILTTTNPGQW